MKAAFYTRVSYYDQDTDVEEYGTVEEAQESYSNALNAQTDGMLGDVYCISYGKLTNDKMTRIAAKSFA